MTSPTKQLHTFLAACSGNWRNTIYIPCREQPRGPGYLLAADRDGCPVIMDVGLFQRLAGMQIDPTECCAQIGESTFETVFAQYLLWRVTSHKENPLQSLCQELSDK